MDDVDLLVREVTGFSIRPRPMAGRNDRCPCGSGKKYKACHLGREEHSLDDRSEWVYLKAKRFLRGFDPAAVDEVAEASATASERPDFRDGMIDSKLLVDIALHEYGVFAEFLRARDALLPDDEALLAAQWAAVDRGLFEIERAQRDRIDMRNIGTDERITVVNLNPSARLAMSTVLFGRPLPVGDTYRAFSGFIEFPRAAVPAMLSALESTDPYEIAACVGELLRRPRLSNTDGDDMMFHTIRWRVGGASVDDAMQRAGLKRDLGDGPRWTLLRDSRNQPGTVIASFRIVDDGDLVGEVNSDERAEEMVALVADVLPEAELIDDEVRTIDEMRVSRDPDATSTMLDPEDEMVHLALTEYIADYEQRWLDMSIPALDGRTPRDALTDPVGREQVEHLLESMAGSDPADPTTMSADRLRAALGL